MTGTESSAADGPLVDADGVPNTYRASSLGLEERRVGRLNAAVDRDMADESRPVIVLVHGLASSWQNFAPSIPLLRVTYRVIAVDLPGFGLSPPLPGRRNFDFDQVAATIVELLDALGVERATLVGHSMGAGVAGSVALATPERVERMVLVGPAGWVKAPWAISLAWRSTVLHWLSRIVSWYIGMPILRGFPSFRNQMFGRLMEHPERMTPKDWGSLVRGSYRGRSTGPAGVRLVRLGLIHRAAEVRMPTTVISGDHDHVVAHTYAVRIAQAIPQARLVTLRGVGHIPQLEAPRSFTDAIVSVPAGNPPQSV